MADIFHAGEVAMQESVMGPRQAAAHRDVVSAFIRDFMPPVHAEFFEAAPWLVVGSLDEDGWPRASVVSRISSLFTARSDSRGFRLDLKGAVTGDPLLVNAKQGAKLALLGIELATRRRNRLNGTVKEAGQDWLDVEVDQSFGNCPKYIQSRELLHEEAGEFVVSTTLDTTLFERCDTIFLASGTAEVGIDVSHRGGPPGFIKVVSETELLLPDYVGNGFFNTLGNLKTEPRLGMLVLDFETSALTQLSCRLVNFAEEQLPGSERVLRLQICRVLSYGPGAFQTRFVATPRPSPFNPSASGDLLTLVRVNDVAVGMRSLTFSLPRPQRYKAGQYGSFQIKEHETVLIRAWTLSSTPRDKPFGEETLTITVKRKHEGAASNAIHDDARLATMTFRLLGVEGQFTLPSVLPLTTVFAGAGSGVTPIISMVRFLAANSTSRCIVLYVSRTEEEAAFAEEFRSLACDRIRVLLAFSRGGACYNTGYCQTVAGRLNSEMLQHLAPLEIGRIYACGPGDFPETVRDLLEKTPGVVTTDSTELITEEFTY